MRPTPRRAKRARSCVTGCAVQLTGTGTAATTALISRAPRVGQRMTTDRQRLEPGLGSRLGHSTLEPASGRKRAVSDVASRPPAPPSCHPGSDLVARVQRAMRRLASARTIEAGRDFVQNRSP